MRVYRKKSLPSGWITLKLYDGYNKNNLACISVAKIKTMESLYIN